MFKKSTVYLLLVSLFLLPKFSGAAGEISTTVGVSSGDGGDGGISIGSPSGLVNRSVLDAIYKQIAKEREEARLAQEVKEAAQSDDEFVKDHIEREYEGRAFIAETRDYINSQAPRYFNTEVSNEITNYANQAVNLADAALAAAKDSFYTKSWHMLMIAHQRILGIKYYVDSVINGTVRAAQTVSELVQQAYHATITSNIKAWVRNYFETRKEAFTQFQKDSIRDILIVSLTTAGLAPEKINELKWEAAARLARTILMVPLTAEGKLFGEAEVTFEGTLEGLKSNTVLSEEVKVLNEEVSKLVETGSKVGGFDTKALQAAKKYVPELKAIRNEYNLDTAKITNTISEMRTAGKTSEEIATVAHGMRRESGMKYKELTPEEIRNFIYKRNQDDYGDPLGPTLELSIEKARQKGLTGDAIWERIIKTSTKPNTKINDFIKALEELK